MLTTPIVRCIKNQLSAEVHYLTKSQYADLLSDNPHIDNLILADVLNNQLVQKLKAQEFDHIIDLHDNFRSMKLRYLMRVPASITKAQGFKKWFYLNTGKKYFEERSMVVEHFDAVKNLNVINDHLGLDLYISESHTANLNRDPNKPIVAINLGGSKITKRIPMRLVAPLISNNYQLHFLGGNDLNIENPGISTNQWHVGKLSIQETANIIAQSDIVISGDTGVMHMAAALRRPILSVWGSTDPIFGFEPYYGHSAVPGIALKVDSLNCRPCSRHGKKKCPKGHMNCINLLSTSDLEESLRKLLA